MPKLTGVVTTLDEVPEAFRSAYELDGDAFRLKEIEFEDPQEVRTKLTRKEQLLQDAKTKLGRYSKFAELPDDDLDELLTLREAKRAGKPLTVDEKQELERLHKKQLDKYGADLAERDSKLTQAEAQLKRYELTEPMRELATSKDVGLFPDEFDYVMFKYGDRLKLVKEDGKKPRVVVLDSEGYEDLMTPKDFFLKVVKAENPRRFQPLETAGTGATNNTRPSGGSAIRLTQAEARDHTRYKAAKAEADRRGVPLEMVD
jgi:hypothetical protein